MIMKEITLRQVRKEITNDTNDKLTYNRMSDIYRFETMTNDSAGYVAGLIEFALKHWDPEMLEFYPVPKSWKPQKVIITFILKNKEML